MGKSSPSPPPAPDPAATAAAQGAANKDAAIAAATINMVNQSTPYGNLSYKNLSEFDEAKYLAANPDVAASIKAGTMESGLAHYQKHGKNEINTGQRGPLDFSYMEPVNGVPRYEATVTLSPEQQQLLSQQTQGQAALNQLGLSQLGRIENAVSQPFSYDGMPALTGSVNGAALPSLVSNLGSPIGNVQTNLDFSGGPAIQSSIQNAGNIQNSLDFSGAPALMDTAALDQERARIEKAYFDRLNPQLSQDRAALEARLANQGITLGSQAYNQAIDELNRKENDLRLGIVGAGGDELSRMFGISLGGRQQGVNELTSQGNFANAAQQQQFTQNAANAQFGNDANAQYAAQQEAMGQFANTAQQQQYAQALANANLSNAARAQALNEQLSMGQFGNAARQQAIQEQAYARDRPLAELSAFMSGGQPQMPQFANTPMTGVQPADIAGPTALAYQGQLAGWNAANNRSNSSMGALAGLGGSALGGWASGGFSNPFSDRRLKKDIVKIGVMANGLNLYSWTYLWGEKSFGVMADEAEKIAPWAIGTRMGYKTVNYEALP